MLDPVALLKRILQPHHASQVEGDGKSVGTPADQSKPQRQDVTICGVQCATGPSEVYGHFLIHRVRAPNGHATVEVIKTEEKRSEISPICLTVDAYDWKLW